MENKFKYTTAIHRIRGLKQRCKVIQGGSSAGKTIAILAILIDKATSQNNLRVSVVGENMPMLKRGAMRDFINILKMTNRYFDEHWNRSQNIYKFANGSYIEFFGADDDSKLRGARRDILYINECNNVRFESYTQLAIRTTTAIYLDYNPVKRFWVHQELIGFEGNDFIQLNYKDNEGLDASIIKELEAARKKAETSDYWKNWVAVYVDGKLGSLEGVIYSNWKYCVDDYSDAELVGVGLDFGFTNDPTAAIAVYKFNGKFVLEEIIFQTGLLNSDIARLLKQAAEIRGWGKSYLVVCDSSEPKSIAELKKSGLKAVGVKKGKDSILYGIGLVQEYEFLVEKSSINLIKELESYSWVRKGGKTINVPEDKNNHIMDAWRYLIMEKYSKRKTSAMPFRVMKN
tara:strand:+ start:375 stop:1577 length:1203 start_codon:yes stop_codon:yes gene_type:complete